MRVFTAIRTAAVVVGVALIIYGYGKASDSYRLVKGYKIELAESSVSAYAAAIQGFPDSIDLYLYFMIAGFFLALFGVCGSVPTRCGVAKGLQESQN